MPLIKKVLPTLQAVVVVRSFGELVWVVPALAPSLIRVETAESLF